VATGFHILRGDFPLRPAHLPRLARGPMVFP
jgi:hypothetical protein